MQRRPCFYLLIVQQHDGLGKHNSNASQRTETGSAGGQLIRFAGVVNTKDAVAQECSAMEMSSGSGPRSRSNGAATLEELLAMMRLCNDTLGRVCFCKRP